MSKSKSIGTLNIIATPIGNLADLSARAAQTLQSVDLIACEDTRTSGVLLRHYGISTKTVAYHEHNADTMRPVLLAQLAEGRQVALISDAGTPLISDPGYKLVRQAQEAGIHVVAVPGASSVTAALSISGMPTDAFYFAGFLPHKSKARSDLFASLRLLGATLVFLESPNRLCAALADAQSVLGDREACVAREITKSFEEVRRASISVVRAHYEAHPPKGELVLMIGGAAKEEKTDTDALDALLVALLSSHSLKEAATLAAEQTGWPRKEVYARALAMKGDE